MPQLFQERCKGVPIATARQTVAQFLDTWLTEKVQFNNRPKTYRSYGDLVRLHIVPTLGKTQLSKLSVQDVHTLLSRKRAEGLSPRTVLLQPTGQ